ncbi:MAG: hypothetical protein IJU79_06235 [Desulfovibrionaceae bacterium]|nr:hypothetical protein [Desulfovibrionaceae bacterium]
MILIYPKAWWDPGLERDFRLIWSGESFSEIFWTSGQLGSFLALANFRLRIIVPFLGSIFSLPFRQA